MQVNKVIKWLLTKTDKSAEGLSVELGRSKSWARVVSLPTRSPALATVCEVADACGYDVALVERSSGEVAAVVEPPERDRATTGADVMTIDPPTRGE